MHPESRGKQKKPRTLTGSRPSPAGLRKPRRGTGGSDAGDARRGPTSLTRESCRSGKEDDDPAAVDEGASEASTEEGRKRPLIHEQMLRFRERRRNPTVGGRLCAPGTGPTLPPALGVASHGVALRCDPAPGICPQTRPRVLEGD